ncbi:hypothetical protein BC567DRAFT_40909 [Phyllosticta citribraziliensis]
MPWCLFFQPRAAPTISLRSFTLLSSDRPEWISLMRCQCIHIADVQSPVPTLRPLQPTHSAYPPTPLVAKTLTNYLALDVTCTLHHFCPPQPPLDLSPCPCCLANAPTSWFKLPSRSPLDRDTPAPAYQGHPIHLQSLYLKCPNSAVHALRHDRNSRHSIKNSAQFPPTAPRTASCPRGLTH